MVEIDFNEEDKTVKTKKNRKQKKLKALIGIVASIFLILGVIFLLRGYLLNCKPNQSFSDFVLDLPQNILTEISNISLGGNRKYDVYGGSIKSPFSMDIQKDRVWLKVTDSINQYIGVLNNSGFNVRYTIPKSAELVTLFQDESVAYVLNNLGHDLPEMHLITSNEGDQIIHTLPKFNYYTSIYFNPEDQLFYYSFIDSGSKFNIEAFNKGKNFKILNNQPFDLSKILYIDSDNIYLYETNNTASSCKYFSLADKIVESIDCKLVRRNDSGINFHISGLNELNLYDVNNNTDRKILNFQNHIEPLLSSATIIYSRVNTQNNTSEIIEFNYKNNSETLISENFPLNITKVFKVGNEYYSISYDQSLKEYVVEKDIEGNLVSYPIGVNRVDLRIFDVKNIEIINQNYRI